MMFLCVTWMVDGCRGGVVVGGGACNVSDPDYSPLSSLLIANASQRLGDDERCGGAAKVVGGQAALSRYLLIDSVNASRAFAYCASSSFIIIISATAAQRRRREEEDREERGERMRL